jgi:hypothetical protein
MQQSRPFNARSSNRVFCNKLNWRQGAKQVTILQKNKSLLKKKKTDFIKRRFGHRPSSG